MQTKSLNDWQRAFGKSDAKKVVQVLCEAWRELVRDSAQTFHGKEKEHAIFQVSSPSRILRLATAFRQAAVDRLEKRNIKNLA